MINLRKLLTVRLKVLLCYSEIWSFGLLMSCSRTPQKRSQEPFTPGDLAGDSPRLSSSYIRERWKLNMKNQKSMIVFVRATWREHVIAVEPHRRANFGLGIHIVPGRQTLVSVSFFHGVLRLIYMRTVLFMWKRDTVRRIRQGSHVIVLTVSIST